MRRVVALLVLVALAALVGTGVTSCSRGPSGTTGTDGTTTGIGAGTGSSASPSSSAGGGTNTGALARKALTVSYGLADLDATWDESSSSAITLAGPTVTVGGSGTTVTGNEVTIDAAGTYVVTGRADDAQIVVDCRGQGLVRIVLNNADLTCTDSAPIYVKNAEKAILVVADGTKNFIADGSSYALEANSGEPTAAIFSKPDLTINGNGSLSVTANCDDGITSMGELRIVSGNLAVQAKNDAITGMDCLGVKAGSVTVMAGGDGLRSGDDLDASKGFVYISGGTFDIAATADGIQAQTTLLVTGGDLSLVTGGGSASASTAAPGSSDTTGTSGPATRGQTGGSTSSEAGLEAGEGLFLEGGDISADSAGDSLHSGGVVQVKGGTFKLAAGCAAIRAGESVAIDGGEFGISACCEGIDSDAITLDSGTVRLASSHEGILGAGSTGTSNATLVINGGYLAVDAGRDGLRINGTVRMNGGTVIVNGPTSSANRALAIAGRFTVTGGYLVAAGGAGRAQVPTQDSTQYSILVSFGSVQAAGTVVRVEDEAGGDVVTMAPSKQYASLLICSPDIKKGATYSVYVGGSSTGRVTDTLYAKGAYSGGAKCATFTVSGIVTMCGTSVPDSGGIPGGLSYGATTALWGKVPSTAGSAKVGA